MKRLLSLLGLGITLGVFAAATVHVKPGQAKAARLRASGGASVNLRKTALGAVLVDARRRTLYLFEKDRNGVSACNTTCVEYWPPLTSQGRPRAGKGVRQSLLQLTRAHNGRHQVTYAGHRLYTFVGDKRAGQTTGENLNNFVPTGTRSRSAARRSSQATAPPAAVPATVVATALAAATSGTARAMTMTHATSAAHALPVPSPDNASKAEGDARRVSARATPGRPHPHRRGAALQTAPRPAVVTAAVKRMSLWR
jgi:predicted lipoprotein with Yx(FWY)xxD motif